jgi:hypothetical protein
METMKQPPAGTLQIGVVYPQTELRGDPDAVRRIGRGAEDLGFDHLLAYEHAGRLRSPAPTPSTTRSTTRS